MIEGDIRNILLLLTGLVTYAFVASLFLSYKINNNFERLADRVKELEWRK